ncbi:hypothetical protein KIPB_009176 [Kipferlia bialata]|uniref:Pyrroline-5-carboxylate reductase catalytic N-terminal domain-containing protein n=1 Tax=Kipferlia bialata TaxID=797122 RepID=A0A9K3D4N3_9EUKA|nr:hypothetical protein KIPB_009176 [Kipferlia bialata]|eukprot:g9176.t1
MQVELERLLRQELANSGVDKVLESASAGIRNVVNGAVRSLRTHLAEGAECERVGVIGCGQVGSLLARQIVTQRLPVGVVVCARRHTPRTRSLTQPQGDDDASEGRGVTVCVPPPQAEGIPSTPSSSPDAEPLPPLSIEQQWAGALAECQVVFLCIPASGVSSIAECLPDHAQIVSLVLGVGEVCINY